MEEAQRLENTEPVAEDLPAQPAAGDLSSRETENAQPTPDAEDDLPTPEAEEPPDKNREFYRPLTFFLFIILGILLVYSYSYPLLRTWDSWGSEHGYNANGLWIFLGSCLLLFWIRKPLRALPKKINFLGLVLVVCALVWSLAFKRGDINAMQTIGVIGLVWSICFYLGGWLFAKGVMFPIFLSLFSVQWGLGSSVVSLKMRIISTRFACWFINATGGVLGIRVLRQGTNISMVDMPDLAFDIAAACSGLQSLMMTSVLALLMCYLMLRTWWKRVIMVLLIVPIAIVNNSLRIVLIAYCGKFFTWIEHVLNLSDGWGKKIAFGAFHEYPGVIVYAMGFLMVWLAAHYLEHMPGVEREAWLTRKALKKEKKRREAEGGDADEPDEDTSPEEKEAPPESPVDYSFYGKLWKHAMIVLALVFCAHLAGNYTKQNIHYTQGLTSVKQHPALIVGERGYRFDMLPYITAFPPIIGGRRMVQLPVSEEELKQLPADTEYFRAMYLPTNTFASCYKAAATLLGGKLSTNNHKVAVAQMQTALEGAFGADAMLSNDMERVIHQALFFRSQLAAGADPRKGNVAFYHLLSSLARASRGPGSIMFAIVQNQSDRHSIHAPEACFPAQGWQIDEPASVTISLGGEEVEVARMDAGFKQQDVRECVMYWYQCQGSGDRKIYATRNYPWLPFKTAFDLILYGRSDRWAFVRLSTTIYEGDTHDDAFDRLCAFVKEAEPYLLYK